MDLTALTTSTPKCGAVGSIDLTVTGGTAPYSYSWSPQESTDEDPLGLHAGAHTVIVMDATGCATSGVFTVPGTASTLAIQGDHIPPCSGGNNGSIDLSISGGTQPYTFTWFGPEDFSANSEDVAGLVQGSYSVLVSDAIGCTEIASFQLVGTQDILLSANSTPTCAQTGSIDLTVTGSSGPFSYTWSNGAVTEDVSGAGAGFYQVLVTDENTECEVVGVFNVELAAVTISVEGVVTNSCSGGHTGAIDVTATGGLGSLSFVWFGPLVDPGTEDLANLASGSYLLQITDVAGCSIIPVFEVGSTQALSLEADIHPTCTDVGAIDLTTSGTAGPFSYSWSSGETSEDIAGLVQGFYSVTVTDMVFGCIVQGGTYQVALPTDFMDLSFDLTQPCFGASNGSVDLTVEGGTQPISHEWYFFGQWLVSTEEDPTQLEVGSYSFTVTDGAGCESAGIFELTGEGGFVLGQAVSPSCPESAIGAIDCSIIGGAPPFTYDWQGSNGFASHLEDLTSLHSGNYTLHVTDADGCVIEHDFVVADAVIDLVGTIISACAPNGEIDISVSPYYGPHDYSWSFGAQTQDLVGLESGVYNLTVTNAFGCMETGTYSIYSCCAADRTLPDGTYSTALSNPASGTIDIQGRLIIDQDFTFEDATVFMEPGAEILMQDGVNLWVNNSTFESCNDVMWKGVTTGNGCIVQLKNTSISDAESGIRAMNSSIVLIEGSEFKNNRVAIEVPDQGGFNSVVIYPWSSTFHAEGPLAQPYLGQTSVVGEKGYAALDVWNISLDFSGLDNTIHHLSNGIVAHRSELNVQNCAIHDIQPDAAYVSPSNGSGIFARGDHAFVTLKQVGFGSTTGALPSFQNCRWGIYTEYMNVYSEENTMSNVGTAYHVDKGNSRTIDILNNKLDTRFDGIQLYMNDGCTRMDIANNDITFATNPPPGQFVKGYTAIIVKEANVKNPNSVIQNNTIRYRTNATTAYAGIRLTSANDYKVLSNTLVMHNNANNYAGIYTSACDRPLISCNTITGSNTNYNVNDGQSAIRNNMGDGVSILCNDVDATTNGIIFSGATLNTDLSGNNIRRHKWGLHAGASTVIQGQLRKGNLWYNAPQVGGLHAWSENANATDYPFTYVPEVIIGGNTEPVQQLPGNWFQFDIGQNYRCDDGQTSYCAQYEGLVCEACKTELDEKVANGDLENNPYTEATKQILEKDLYKKLDNAPSLLTNNQELADFYAAMQGTNVAQFKQITDDYLAVFHLDASIVAYLAANKAQIQALMDQLKVAMAELADEALTPAQRQTIMANANGLQLSIRNLTALNNQALALASTSNALQADNVKAANNGVGTTELIETNEKQVKEIYLSTVAKEVDSFTNAEATALLAIANQCPMAGGNAVYRARSLYALIDDDVEYNDASLCLQHGIIYKSLEPAATAQVSIQPNPACDAATLLYTMAADTYGTLIIYDALGKVAQRHSLSADRERYQFSVAALHQGAYHYVVSSGAEQIGTGRLVIVR
ncbi:MAG: hypothetical protein JNL43_09445 [Flavobacteriales bacterium]|nr:hypothetical protein [Flavobacteriales bacterium]